MRGVSLSRPARPTANVSSLCRLPTGERGNLIQSDITDSSLVALYSLLYVEDKDRLQHGSLCNREASTCGKLVVSVNFCRDTDLRSFRPSQVLSKNH